MLKLEASESSNPSIFVEPETPLQEFDPYDPIHLEKEHQSSRTPSPLAYAASISPSPQTRSRGPSPDRRSRSLSPESTIFGKSSDNLEAPKVAQSSPPERAGDPPPYPGSMPDLHENRRSLLVVPPQDRSQASSRVPSPRPVSGVRNDGGGDVRPERPAPALQERPIQFATPAMPSHRELPMDMRSPPSLTQPLARGSRESVYTTGPPPSKQERERLDARSTHHTISTYSSSQTRNGGPPPNRRVPRHLVMPAPLNSNGNRNGLHQPVNPVSRPPSISPFAPVKAQVLSPPRTPRSPLSQMPPIRAPLQPVSAPVRAQEIQIAKSSKLRKRVSTIGTPSSGGNTPSAPVITTVSFAPPVIATGHTFADHKPIGLTKSEKVPKRVLSKRRGDL